jgi:pyruvate/2-oxoglutarate/acetoin dehydrogenase E1 component
MTSSEARALDVESSVSASTKFACANHQAQIVAAVALTSWAYLTNSPRVHAIQLVVRTELALQSQREQQQSARVLTFLHRTGGAYARLVRPSTPIRRQGTLICAINSPKVTMYVTNDKRKGKQHGVVRI